MESGVKLPGVDWVKEEIKYWEAKIRARGDAEEAEALRRFEEKRKADESLQEVLESLEKIYNDPIGAWNRAGLESVMQAIRDVLNDGKDMD